MKFAVALCLLSACFAAPPDFRSRGKTADDSLFGVSSIAGNSALSAQHIKDGFVVRGAGLDRVRAVEIFNATGDLLARLGISAASESELTAQLDPAGAANLEAAAGATLTFRVTHETKGALTRDITVLRGDTGPAGPTGPLNVVSGSTFVLVDGSNISLVPGPCTAGQVLKVSGGAWTCGDDVETPVITPVSSVTGGTGVTVTGGSNALVSIAFGPGVNQAARGNHDHFGATWSGSTASHGLSVINNNTSTAQETSAIYGEADTSQNGAWTRAAVRGTNSGVSNGVGVIGDATGPGSKGVVGIAAGTAGAAGVYGYNGTNSPTAYGVWGTSVVNGGVGVFAENTAGGTALKVDGIADFTAGAARWPIRFVSVPQASLYEHAICDPGEQAIGGGCYGTSANLLTTGLYNTTGGAGGVCNDTTFTPGTGLPNAWCCRVPSGNVGAEVVCLRVQ